MSLSQSSSGCEKGGPLGRVWSGFFLALVIPSTSCGTESGSPPAIAIVWDSAGVEIVEHAGGSHEALARWSAGPDPVLDIGDQDDGADHAFGHMAFPRRLSTGEILVADLFSNELRIFDTKGGFLRKFGGAGQGRGEFRNVSAVMVDHLDSIFVSDQGRGYLAVFARDGSLVRDLVVPQNGDISVRRVAGRFEDGSFLVRGIVPVLPPSEGRFRTREALWTMGERGGSEAVADIGTFAAADLFSASLEGGGGGWQRLPFSRDLHIVVAGALSYLSNSDAYELLGYDSSGLLRRIIRRDAPPRAVTEEDIEEDERRRTERTRRRMPGPRRPDPSYPAVLPALAEIIADRLGNLWVRDYEPNLSRSDSTVWTVFTNDGRMLAGTTLPSAWRIGEIGPDYLLVVEPDAFDADYLKMYELRKGDDTL